MAISTLESRAITNVWAGLSTASTQAFYATATFPRFVATDRESPTFRVRLGWFPYAEQHLTREAHGTRRPAYQPAVSALPPKEAPSGLWMFVQPEARVDAGARAVVLGSLVPQLAGMSSPDTPRGFVRLIPSPEDGGPADQLPARIQALVSLPLEDVEPSREDELRGAARAAVGDSPVAADEDREPPLDSPLVFPLSPPRRRTNGRLILKATETATRNYDHTLQLDVRLVPVQDAKVGREAAALTEASEAQGQGSGAAGPRRALVIETAPSGVQLMRQLAASVKNTR